MAENWGGRRPGAGRKPKSSDEIAAAAIEAGKKKIARRFAKLVEAEMQLAQGEVVEVTGDPFLSGAQEWIVACKMVAIARELLADTPAQSDRNCSLQELDYADLPTEVKQQVTGWVREVLAGLGLRPGEAIFRRPPDRRAIEYCIDRIAGKAKQTVESVTAEDVEKVFGDYGQAWNEAVDAAVDRGVVTYEDGQQIKADADTGFGELCAKRSS